MRALKTTLYALSFVGLTFFAAGCGQDFVGKIACKQASDCTSQTGTLFTDGSADFLPQCCMGYCQLPAGGCESGFRYLDNDPGYGDCVTADNACMPSGPMPDLSMPTGGDM